MMLVKKLNWLVAIILCSLLLIAGCATVEQKSATLALKFAPGDIATYKAAREWEKSVKFEGEKSKAPLIRGEKTGSKLEFTFAQEIQSINDQGNAIAKNTIKELKYSEIVQGKEITDFDSSREVNLKGADMVKLIGKEYTLEISPAGKVVNVIDTTQIMDTAKGNMTFEKTVKDLFSEDAIKSLYEAEALPSAGKNKLQVGDSWSNTKAVSFDLMGYKGYEKIYTVKQIIRQDDHDIAIIEMNAIPSAEMTGELQKKRAISSLAKMFDNTESYTGQLKFDITSGKVKSASEKIEAEWVAVDPEVEKDKKPNVLKMKTLRFYSLEKLD